MTASVYDFEVKDIQGNAAKLASYRGQALLIVNVASRCGFTPQYDGLEKLHRKFKDRGFAVLGFPCNQFGSQEPGTDQEIQQFCDLTYHVSFPMFSKIEVNGKDTHPLYQFLKSSEPGLLGTEGIKWNFTKFLVDRDGKVIHRFAPTSSPESLEPEIERELQKQA